MRNPDEEEKDTRLKFARPKPAGVTPLQAKMLKLAGQQAPIKEKKEARHFERDIALYMFVWFDTQSWCVNNHLVLDN